MNKSNFLEAVRKLDTAFSEMSKVWEKVDSVTVVGVVDYPFAGSFDELARKVTAWREACEARQLEPEIIGYIDIGRDNVLRMKSYVDAALAAPYVEDELPTDSVALYEALKEFADEDNWHFNESYEILEWAAGLDHGEPWIAAQQAIKDSKEAGGMFSLEDYLIERIAEEAETQGMTELTPVQLKDALNGVMYWFQETVGDSVSTAVFNVRMDAEDSDTVDCGICNGNESPFRCTEHNQ